MRGVIPWHVKIRPLRASWPLGAFQSVKDVLLTSEFRRGRSWVQGSVDLACGFCMVVSQCCDLALRNGKFTNLTFRVTPLRFAGPQAQNSQNEAADGDRLRKNRQLQEQVGRYCVPQTAPRPSDCWVDFGFISTVSGQDYDRALSARVLQMAEIDRIYFKTKLGHFFARATDEEVGAGLYPPDSPGLPG